MGMGPSLCSHLLPHKETDAATEKQGQMSWVLSFFAVVPPTEELLPWGSRAGGVWPYRSLHGGGLLTRRSLLQWRSRARCPRPCPSPWWQQLFLRNLHCWEAGHGCLPLPPQWEGIPIRCHPCSGVSPGVHHCTPLVMLLRKRISSAELLKTAMLFLTEGCITS